MQQPNSISMFTHAISSTQLNESVIELFRQLTQFVNDPIINFSTLMKAINVAELIHYSFNILFLDIAKEFDKDIHTPRHRQRSSSKITTLIAFNRHSNCNIRR
ncbi:hypothetical protein CDAR_126941 [Caerostris darwini]|uniref:Uncharacterized protein n=1 Tax=Caerostris darwini TaxID=1538125 RepID=A0AAV4RXD0_9ARAC|nr:hypothetical protein CDAR_126941 [Caerostris darwini]